MAAAERTKFRLGLATGDVGSVAIVEGGSEACALRWAI